MTAFHPLRTRAGRGTARVRGRLDFRSLRQRQCVLDINAKVADSALNLGVTEQDLHGSQIAGGFVDDRGLRPAERMRAIVLAA